VTIGIAGSQVRWTHLIALSAMLVVAMAAGILVGRVSERGPSATHDGLSASGAASRVDPAMNHLRLRLADALPGSSRRFGTPFCWSPLPHRYLDDARIVRGSDA
jgi:hypothetical protein